MKKINRCFCLLLLIVGFAQVFAKEESLSIEDYAKMSQAELNAAFVLAVREHHAEKVEKLLQAGANSNTPILYTTTDGGCDWTVESTAFMYAVKQNCPSLVKVLKVEKQLNEALDIAIKEGYSEVVVELVKGGADINYVNKDTDTPLITAIKNARAITEFSPQVQARVGSRWAQRRDIIHTLLKEGANISYANKHGRTALMEAVIEHDLSTVQRLLQAPEINTGSFFGFGTKPINYADEAGNTALILAVQRVRFSYTNNQEYNICKNSQNIIKELLETPGIDPYRINKKGETAIALLEQLQKKR